MRKYRSEDQAFFNRRDKFALDYPRIDLNFAADNWPLFAGTVNIARFLAIYELAKKVIDLPGHFCELGCWNGTNLVYLAKVVNILKPEGCTELIGFDSFEGLTDFDADKDAPAEEKGARYCGSVQLLENALKVHQLHEFVQLVKGDIAQTLPEFVARRKDIRFSFIYVDLDLYAPVKTAVEFLYQRLLTGGIMVFDEYNTEDWPGETSAVHDILGDKVQLRGVPYTRQPTAYIVK